MVDHLQYSPDLAPSDYYLFPNLKKFLSGKRFLFNEAMGIILDNYLNNIRQSVMKLREVEGL